MMDGEADATSIISNVRKKAAEATTTTRKWALDLDYPQPPRRMMTTTAPLSVGA